MEKVLAVLLVTMWPGLVLGKTLQVLLEKDKQVCNAMSNVAKGKETLKSLSERGVLKWEKPVGGSFQLRVDGHLHTHKVKKYGEVDIDNDGVDELFAIAETWVRYPLDEILVFKKGEFDFEKSPEVECDRYFSLGRFSASGNMYYWDYKINRSDIDVFKFGGEVYLMVVDQMFWVDAEKDDSVGGFLVAKYTNNRVKDSGVDFVFTNEIIPICNYK